MHDRRRQGGVWLATALAIAAAGCSPETPADDESTESTNQAVLNGTIVNPWPNGTPAYTRAIVKLPGCTGTLLTPEWVQSAKHCTFGVGGTVTSRRPTGDVNRQIDRVIGNERLTGGTDENGQLQHREDAVLLHLDQPITDVPLMPLYWGSTAGITNQSITCYGYGADALGAACGPGKPACTGGATCNPWSSSGAGWCVTSCTPGMNGNPPTCPQANQFCKSNICYANTAPLSLRKVTAATTTHSDQVEDPGTIETKVDSAGRITFPGDSGGPCFFKDKLAAHTSAGGLYWGIQTSEADYRGWMFSIMEGERSHYFHAADSSAVYFLDKSNQLWLDTGTSANRTLIDSNVRDFQAIDASNVYVLGIDRNLWREHPDQNSRDLVDANVRTFRAVNGRIVYVLGKDGNLWNEHPDSGHRSLVDSNVLNFKPLLTSGTQLFVLGSDRKLWNVDGDLNNRSLVDSNVVDFEPIDNSQVFVLGGDFKLWRETGDFHGRLLIDSNVQTFHMTSADTVYVLGQDATLWRENNTGRTKVDASVLAFQPLDSTTVYVMGKDGKLWREIGDLNNRVQVDAR